MHAVRPAIVRDLPRHATRTLPLALLLAGGLAGCTSWRQGPSLEPRRNWPIVIELRGPTAIAGATGADSIRDVVRLRGDVTKVRQGGDTLDLDLEYVRLTTEPMDRAPAGELRRIRVKLPRSAVLAVGQPRFSARGNAVLVGSVVLTSALVAWYLAFWAFTHSPT